MKGTKVFRAKASNAIDIYPLLADAVGEGVFEDTPSGRELKSYYFKAMIEELSHPMHFWYLARRGRGFLGYLHAIVIPGRWSGALDTIYVDMLFVDKKYRNRGVAGKLIEELKKDADHNGITNARFSCPEELTPMFIKRGAKKARTLMETEL